ncbi:MAG TPA: V4R domain-containing protein [Thermoplasmata archaeon]|jgi:predicted hydrocarbon binding protein|nr:V4R domain-containing protein [Thermoplasmata archaeon]
MGERTVRGENSSGALLDLQTTATQSRSFAELVAALNKLNVLESALATAIARAKVPAQEVRTLLRAQTPQQCENAPAFQFMREVFAQVGIPLEIEAVGRFSLTFSVDGSPYARLFSGEKKKTCAFVSEALAQFLATDLGLPADVDEVECRNAGASRCRFATNLDPVEVTRRVLDSVDWSLLKRLAEGMPREGMDREFGMSAGERDFRIERLIGYGLVGGDGRVLPAGKSLAAQGSPVDEGFEPPWRDVSRLTEAIASAASFAEALTEVAPREPRREVVADAGTTALAAECHSFAELLARASKRRTWE